MKILLIKFAALGDVLRTISLLPAIKKKWKNSEITFFTKKEAKDLFRNNFYISKLLIYNKENIKELEKEYFDLVINLDEDYEACSLATRIRKKELRGFYLKDGKIVPTPSAREWFSMSAFGKKTPKIKGMPYNDYLKKKNKKTWQQLMSEIIGINVKDCSLPYTLSPKQKKFALDFARRYNLNRNNLIIGLNTGAGGKWPAKNLSIEKTAKLAEKLYKDLNAQVILFGGPEEIERNNEIVAKAKVPIINAGCGNDLFEFPALISLCHLFITSDTFGMHLAIALKRKIIAFFGPTSAAEIELFGLGEKIIARHPCYCCYKPDCKADSAYSIEEIFQKTKELLKTKITIIITAFKEPKLGETLKSILRQKIKYPHEIIVSAPDKGTIGIVKNYAKKYKQIKLFKDPGKGKSFALNLLLKKLKNSKSDILILTDGDVVLEDNSINEISKIFNDPFVGCTTGRVLSANPKNNKFGYWSHLLADAGAHRMRAELDEQGKFLECSGYLFAFRNNRIINQIPLDVAEDSIIPYYFWKQGYKIKYTPKAKVFVKNPTHFKDWLKQRKRTAKAHETLTKYAPDFPKIKSFKNEATRVFWALQYPKNLKELVWTIQLIYARLYMWLSVFYDTYFRGKYYQDAWERIESTKI
ncbi:hypothetical protein B6U80_02115 [Candidatus Pacearchaeota archaeon ex4484_26]|nr:MAG: hypothetical protein B6U80_02115 [Candidatus Pacearchaeota archaeon ex4484_26]